jgi:hypothetical protein
MSYEHAALGESTQGIQARTLRNCMEAGACLPLQTHSPPHSQHPKQLHQKDPLKVSSFGLTQTYLAFQAQVHIKNAVHTSLSV